MLKRYTPIPLIVSPGNCLCWIDCADERTITSSSGSVSAVADKSGNGNNATQGTGANQPTTGSATINGLNVLTFNGSTSQLSLPSFLPDLTSNPFTMFMVFNLTTNTPNVRAFTDNIAQIIRFANNSGATQIQATLQATSLSLGVSAFNNPMAAYMQWDGSSACQARANTGSLQTGTTSYSGQPTSMAIGGSGAQAWPGTIAELICYNKYLSASQLLQVQQYFSRKWGIAVS